MECPNQRTVYYREKKSTNGTKRDYLQVECPKYPEGSGEASRIEIEADYLHSKGAKNAMTKKLGCRGCKYAEVEFELVERSSVTIDGTIITERVYQPASTNPEAS